MAAAGPPPPAATGVGLQADAFKKIYPEQFFARFLEDGIRPDGRPLGRCRETSVAVHAIGCSDGSAVVKIGSTSVMVGAKADISRPAEGAPGHGKLSVSVDLAPFAAPGFRPGRTPEFVSTVSHRLGDILCGSRAKPPYGVPTAGAPSTSEGGGSGGVLDLRQLCISEGKACWAVTLEVYILDVDGSLLDAVLLAAVAALRDTVLPAVQISQDGHVRRQQDAAGAGAQGAGDKQQPSRRLALAATPLALSSCLYRTHLLSDPTSEEEGIAGAHVTVVVDETGRLHGEGTAAAQGRAAAPCVICHGRRRWRWRWR